MQLIFKRNKIFLSGNDRYVGTVGADGRAPSWIASTDTFKMGIKDGSIIDLKAVAEAEEAEVETAAEQTTEVQQPKGLQGKRK